MKVVLWLVLALWSFERSTWAQRCDVIMDNCSPCCRELLQGTLQIVERRKNGLLIILNDSNITELPFNLEASFKKMNGPMRELVCKIDSKLQHCVTELVIPGTCDSVVKLQCTLEQRNCLGGNMCSDSDTPVLFKFKSGTQGGATGGTQNRATDSDQGETTGGATESNQADSKKGGATDNKVAIASGTVIGSLIVVILAALLAVQLIRMFRKKQHHSTNGNGSISLDNATYLQRLPVEPLPHVFPDECAVMKESYIHGSTPQPQEPSPYEAPSVAIGCYAILGPPDETESRGQSGGRQTDPNHYTEQHVYEDADKYTSTTHVANGDYEAAMKHKKRVQFQNTLPQTPDTSQDYAEPDDALFDEEKYETQPKIMKQGRGGGEKDGVGMAKAPISTWCHHPDDEDYSIPDDAIHPQEHSSNGAVNKERVTIESTTYETAQAKSGTATASVGKEPQKMSTTYSAETSTEEREGEAGSSSHVKSTISPGSDATAPDCEVQKTGVPQHLEEHSLESGSNPPN